MRNKLKTLIDPLKNIQFKLSKRQSWTMFKERLDVKKSSKQRCTRVEKLLPSLYINDFL